MKFLHTSDWHLGRTLHGVDLHAAQRAFVDHLVDLVQEHDVAAVLVSGDVFDRAIPAVETVRIFSDALSRLAAHTTVVVTPGNHDSAARVAQGAAVMRDSVRLLADVDAIDRPVLVTRGEESVAVYGLPYLDPDTTRAHLADAEGAPPARSHAGVLGAAMHRVRVDLAGRGTRSIVMAHAFVIGAEPSDSERDISVGGVESVPSGVFDGVDYVALGHLHGPQVVPVPHSDTVARYSGSPLAYSFSERHHAKSVALVDVPTDGPVAVQLLPVPVPRPLTELVGSLDDLLADATDHAVDHWVRAVVTDPALPTDGRAALQARFAHLLQLVHQPVTGSDGAALPEVTEAMSPAAVAGDFVAYVSSADVTDTERTVLQAAHEAVRAREAAR